MSCHTAGWAFALVEVPMRRLIPGLQVVEQQQLDLALLLL